MIDNKNRKTAKLLRVKCIIQTKSNLYIEQYILPNKFDSQILKKKKQKNKIYDDVLLSSRPSKGLLDTFVVDFQKLTSYPYHCRRVQTISSICLRPTILNKKYIHCFLSIHLYFIILFYSFFAQHGTPIRHTYIKKTNFDRALSKCHRCAGKATKPSHPTRHNPLN